MEGQQQRRDLHRKCQGRWERSAFLVTRPGLGSLAAPDLLRIAWLALAPSSALSYRVGL